MFEALMENFKYMDNSTKQGIMFASGIAIYYLITKLMGKK